MGEQEFSFFFTSIYIDSLSLRASLSFLVFLPLILFAAFSPVFFLFNQIYVLSNPCICHGHIIITSVDTEPMSYGASSAILLPYHLRCLPTPPVHSLRTNKAPRKGLFDRFCEFQYSFKSTCYSCLVR